MIEAYQVVIHTYFSILTTTSSVKSSNNSTNPVLQPQASTASTLNEEKYILKLYIVVPPCHN